MTGEIKAEIGEMPPAMGRSMRIKIMVPYWRIMPENSTYISVGRMPPKIFSPSRGKMGTRLKMAKVIFMMTRIEKIEYRISM